MNRYEISDSLTEQKVPFLGISLLRNQTETLATQATTKIDAEFSWMTLLYRCKLQNSPSTNLCAC